MANKTLSIIAVVINNLEVNKRFVSSVWQYTTGDYELILIDNASTDKKSIKFFKRNADKYFRFDKIISLSKAWNKGIELSEGKYVAVVNNDVVVPSNWFAPLKQTLDKDPKAGMVSPITLWLLVGLYGNKITKKMDQSFGKPYKLQKFKDVVWGEFMLFTRKAVDAVGGFNPIYERGGSEDLEILFQLYDKGFNVYTDPRVFVYHEGSRSQTPDIISKKDRNKYWNKNWKLFLSRWPKYTKGWK
ncbi:MAG: glycosyltransferase [Candidatus Doudnabacteria bacterium]|nr:glycosyltransferase [Candidatus Doudnabacteria bacterium]